VIVRTGGRSTGALYLDRAEGIVRAVWWAGVGWRDGGFEVAVVDGTGAEVVAPVGFAGGRLRDLVQTLRGYAAQAGDGFAAVIDSSNGVLDGHLTAAGLTAYRADPPASARPLLGSPAATDLARWGPRDPGTLHRLTLSTGTLAGRVEEFLAHIAGSADVERELTGAGLCLTRGTGTAPEVAITFDDGPDPVHTPPVLDILRRHGVTASFFCVGLPAAAYPDLVRRAVAEGHLVGNHTWSHPYLPDLTREQLLRQVDATAEILTEVGATPTLVRPPYGSRTPDTMRWLAGNGMTTVLWDIDTEDWSRPGTDTVVANATTATAGSVILMHDAGGDRGQTVAALPQVLTRLLDRGYRFVTVDRLGRR
jgi:peptidoglycan/xylan/chitin deacetylase (PgdA/CDA1 family)